MANFLIERNDIFNESSGENNLILDNYNHRINLSEAQTTYPALYKNNLEAEPGFMDIESKDFHLNSSSQMIDNGTFLTNTSSNGSGTILPIFDVNYFFDGFGVQEELGDIIQLEGQTTTARIVSINYSGNSLTLNQSLTWQNNTGVFLAYKGDSPDMGAFEYDPSVDSAPVVTLSYPPGGYINDTSQYVNLIFNASLTDDRSIKNCSLWHNATGVWRLNQTQELSGASNITSFSLNLTNVSFIWNMQCFDNASQSDWGSNRSVILNYTAAAILITNTEQSSGGGIASKKNTTINSSNGITKIVPETAITTEDNRESNETPVGAGKEDTIVRKNSWKISEAASWVITALTLAVIVIIVLKVLIVPRPLHNSPAYNEGFLTGNT
jgi:hypothetical protein